MNEIMSAIIGGGIVALIAAAYLLFGGKASSGPARNPFEDKPRADPKPVDIEKEIEVIKNEAEKDRPKIDLQPVDIVAVNAKLDQLRAKYKKPE